MSDISGLSDLSNLANLNTINNQNDNSEANWVVETQADAIVDFTETNPFGEFGNKGSSI